ncbi:MAG: ABC-F family ATP-binding cassette domain-containing protein [Phycisphaerales bacterium]|nr:MAG: ABC-F family ATP-binding cassette domain-containing protein [Phycisphaerales bacterium]
MPIVELHEIHKSFGPDVVLENLDLVLYPGRKVGMVGPNGSGKSTILRLILGHIQPDMGRVVKRKALRIGYLPQEVQFTGDHTVLEQMHAGVEHLGSLQQEIHETSKQMESLRGAELKAKMRQYDRLCHNFEMAGGYEYEVRIEATLAGMGFGPELREAKTSALSGGQLSRLALAQVLMLDTDLLLLDEPTNHLDLQATEWLERFLAAYRGAAVIISHDRYLLDSAATKIIEVARRQAKVYAGNYSNYVRTKHTTRLRQQRRHAQRVEMVERTRDFIARNKDREGMRGTARGRKKQLNRLLKQNPDFLEKPAEQKTIDFSFAPVRHTSDLVLRCQGLAKRFGPVSLFEDLTFDVLAGRRIGITGPNGSGKTTLLKLALGRIKPSAGTIRMGPELRVGYLDQHADVLDPDKSVLEVAQQANPHLSNEQLRNRLGAFLFTGDDVFKLCSRLSGGQRNRLMLCRLVLAEPHVLVMDEPTNHLDIPGREMFEHALAQFDGAVIVVSHDRYFLDRVVDTLLVLGSDPLGNRCIGRTEFISGRPVYSTYASLLRQRRDAERPKNKSRGPAPKRRSAAAAEKKRTRTPENLRRFNKYSLEQLEQMITALEQDLEKTKQRFGDADVYKNPGRLAELQVTFNTKQAELDLLYQAYERRAG